MFNILIDFFFQQTCLSSFYGAGDSGYQVQFNGYGPGHHGGIGQ